MDEKRRLEIALNIIKWRWRQLGTERFMGELKTVVEDEKIEDGEMFEFFKLLADEMVDKK